MKNRKRRIAVAAISAVSLLGVAGAATVTAGAAQPANPGCFGKDRAAWIHANSGAEWGVIAGERAGDNGTINQAYKDSCGGSPVVAP